MKRSNFLEGWNEKRGRRVHRHYEHQSDEEAVAEDEEPSDGGLRGKWSRSERAQRARHGRCRRESGGDVVAIRASAASE